MQPVRPFRANSVYTAPCQNCGDEVESATLPVPVFCAYCRSGTREEKLLKFRVWLRSTPGPYEQYNGKVDVIAANRDGAIAAAFATLERSTFPDRGRSWWKVEKVELL